MRLSDQIIYSLEAITLLDNILKRARLDIIERARDMAFKNDEHKVNKATILTSIRSCRPLYDFIDPED